MRGVVSSGLDPVPRARDRSKIRQVSAAQAVTGRGPPMSHPNEDLVRKGYEAFSTGDTTSHAPAARPPGGLARGRP